MGLGTGVASDAPGTSGPGASSAGFDCLDHVAAFERRHFGFEGRCKGHDERSGCAYHDLRKLELGDGAGVDQRGIVAHQVTFPGEEHLWAALSIREPSANRFCWIGGAVVGRNPMAMTWGGPSGSKARKNNFLFTQGGRMVVEGARVHNIHDAFLASSEGTGFDIRRSWISWNRDDFFEGYLHDLRIEDTLVDGTFTFLSDPDGVCDEGKAAGERVVVIENSLIRLQRMPGPYSGHTDRWRWEPEGGHNTLWKLDSCGWADWPRFVLRNNVFLVEGPRTTRRELHETDCRLALPSDCEGAPLANLAECRNNLFLYTDYHHWRDADTAPGPVPRPDGPFHAVDNPDFLPNGRDCYQRLTDDPHDPGYADVRAIWRGLRARWIERHTVEAPAEQRLMRVPGVDFPPFESGSRVIVESRSGKACLTSLPDGALVSLRCTASAKQRFTVVTFDDGRLPGAVLLQDERGRYLRSPPPPLDGAAEAVRSSRWPVFAQAALGGKPPFAERWYLLPLDELDAPGGRLFGIESDVIGRSFVRESAGQVVVQSSYAQGVNTPLPQPRFSQGDDPALQWRVKRVDEEAEG